MSNQGYYGGQPQYPQQRYVCHCSFVFWPSRCTRKWPARPVASCRYPWKYWEPHPGPAFGGHPRGQETQPTARAFLELAKLVTVVWKSYTLQTTYLVPTTRISWSTFWNHRARLSLCTWQSSANPPFQRKPLTLPVCLNRLTLRSDWFWNGCLLSIRPGSTYRTAYALWSLATTTRTHQWQSLAFGIIVFSKQMIDEVGWHILIS